MPQAAAETSSSAELPPAAASRRTKRTLSPGRRRLFRLLALCLVGTALVALELACRAFGVGENLDLVVPAPGRPLELQWQLNSKADTPLFTTIPLSGPEPRRFDLPKPPDTYRIVVLGESTVEGFPYPSTLAFPRQLELILQKQFPERHVEVLNVGITGINTIAIADLAAQSIRAEPDLIVLHAGHNEFYGPGGVSSTFGRLPAQVLPWTFSARRLRLTQWYVPLLQRRGNRTQLTELLPAELSIPLDSDLVPAASRQFRSNLERIVKIAEHHHVPLLLTPVASNLRDQSPIRSFHSRPLTHDEETQWLATIEQAEALQSNDDAQGASDLLERAAEIDSKHARLLYRQGQCLETLGRFDEALRKFQEARDRDGCRFRAPSAFRDVVREVAADNSQSVFYFDWVAAAEALTAPRAPGHELFLEHVHYTFQGHFQLAHKLAEFIQSEILHQPWDSTRATSFEDVSRELHHSAEDEIAARSFALQVTQINPFVSALDSAGHKKVLSDEVTTRLASLTPDDRAVFSALSMAEIGDDLPAALARGWFARGDHTRAADCYGVAVSRRPWDLNTRVAYATALLRLGRLADSQQQLDQALRLDAASVAALGLRDRLRGADHRSSQRRASD